MKHLFLTLLFLGSLVLSARAESRPTKIVLHLGDVTYARFESNGKKIRLEAVTKEKDERAQVIFTLTREPESLGLKLTVENKFTRDFIYKAVIRSKRLNREVTMDVLPVVGGKLAFESFPPLTDEVTLSGFKLEQ